MTSQTLVVADAGVLIHLDELGALDVLSNYTTVFVPNAVWEEVLHHRPQALKHKQVNLLRFPGIVYLPEVSALAGVFTLHHGECEALSLCLQKGVTTLLTDDTAARLAAKNLNLKAHGSLGLLIRAVRCDLRSADEVLALLAAIPEKTSLHIRPQLLSEVIAEVKQEWAKNE